MSGPRWIGASHVLGRDIPTDEPYPHICGNTVTGLMTRRVYYLSRKSCAACAQEASDRTSVEKGQ